MRYCTIGFAILVLAGVASVQGQDRPAPTTQPATQPARPNAVQGTTAEQAETIYQNAIEQADEDFQKKVNVLRQEYMQKADLVHKTYVTGLRNAQAAETRKGNLEAVLAVKNLADAVEASGPPVAPAIEGAKRQPVATMAPAVKAAQGGKNDWTVLFRSDDPSIWNTDTNKGHDSFAIPLANAPQGIQYLKMALPNGICVIISMSREFLGMNREFLGNNKMIGDGKYGWTGECPFDCKAYHLGIVGREFPMPIGCVNIGKIGNIGSGNRDATGWGFGHHHWHADKQGFAWAGKDIGPVVFEISVKTTPLTEAEKANLKE